MSVFKRLLTALRGGVNDAAEAVADSQGLRILDQELRDAAAQQEKAKQALATIMAKVKLKEQRVDELNAIISDLSSKALKAQEAGKMDLALEIAGVVGERTRERDAEAKMLGEFSAFSEKQRAIVTETERRIKAARQQADITGAREAIHKAQASVMHSNGNTQTGLNSAMESLNRIREKQDQREAEMNARQQLEEDTSGAALEKKMADAGLMNNEYSPEAILANLGKTPQ